LNWEAIIFWALATMVIVPALGVVFSKNIVHMAFWLLAALVGVAGLYLLMGADFLGMTQIFVYVGGISVLLLFGIMLTNSEPIYVRKLLRRPKMLPALVVGGLVYVVLLQALLSTGWLQNPSEPTETARGLGIFLLSEYILPFEIVSVVLLVVLIGAAFIARRDQGGGTSDG
jgi:NADH-quinone oxidoreductase subunit J